MGTEKTSDRLAFTQAIPLARPSKSPLYVVWSPKLGRQIRFFNGIEQKAWVLIESDPGITKFCEYPCYIDKVKKNAAVTFWVQRESQSEFWLVERKNHLYDNGALANMADFVSWSERAGIKIRVIKREEIDEQSCRIENWSHIIRNSVIWCADISERYINAIEMLFQSNSSVALGDLASMLNEFDVDQLEATTLYLIQQGRLSSHDLDSAPLSDQTRVFRS